MPHFHFIMDAYDCIEEHGNDIMAVYELLNNVAVTLGLEPVMPPFMVPYYYCEDAEDGGISAFLICAGGGHITIHTFPYRSCYFLDILTDRFFSVSEAKDLILHNLYANRVQATAIDRRAIYQDFGEEEEPSIDEKKDFGPHYMIEIENVDMTMSSIYKWLDSIASKINMLSISRPYVIYDKKTDPSYISGILVVAQSHIALHYDIAEKKAYIDIFSCAFLENSVIVDLFKENFGENVKWRLYSRGSKHNERYKRKEARITVNKHWRSNV